VISSHEETNKSENAPSSVTAACFRKIVGLLFQRSYIYSFSVGTEPVSKAPF